MFSASILGAFCLAAGALAQVPPGTSPSVSTPLGVQFGATRVTPGIMLSTADARYAPTVSSATHYPGLFQIFMIDLDINFSQVVSNPQNTSALASLTPGYGANRTTRLHWWSTNLTQTANGTFVKLADTADVAGYATPMPPVGDMAHAYTLYLVPQPDGYRVPALAAGGAYVQTSSMDRMNFSLAGVVEAAGGPVAANYFRTARNASGVGAANGTGGLPAATAAPIVINAAARLGTGAVVAGFAAVVFAILI